MGFFSSIMGGLAQTAHSMTKGVDEAAGLIGAPALIRSATGAMAEMTGRAAGGFGGGAEIGATVEASRGSFSFSGMKDALFGSPEPAAPVESVKLGRNAALFNGTITGPAVDTSPFHATMDQVALQANLPNLKQAGASMAV